MSRAVEMARMTSILLQIGELHRLKESNTGPPPLHVTRKSGLLSQSKWDSGSDQSALFDFRRKEVRAGLNGQLF